MSNFTRKLRRQKLRAQVLADLRDEGCDCNPDIRIEGELGGLAMVSIAHDRGCQHPAARMLEFSPN